MIYFFGMQLYNISHHFYGIEQVENYDQRLVECCVPVPCLELKVVCLGKGGLSFSCPGCDLTWNQYCEFVIAFLHIGQFAYPHL